MRRLYLKSMILDARVTQADVQYVGSITIDEALMEKADLSEHEKVLVVDRTNGQRLETYVIRGERGSGVIWMNGAAAHLVKEDDRIDVMAFGWSTGGTSPVVVQVDEYNYFRRYVDEAEL